MYRNPFRRLQDLVGAPALQVGTVLSISGSLATVELPDGGRVQARGDATVGALVFVRGDVIEGPAPSLPIDLVDV